MDSDTDRCGDAHAERNGDREPHADVRLEHIDGYVHLQRWRRHDAVADPNEDGNANANSVAHPNRESDRDGWADPFAHFYSHADRDADS
mgnify:FL=1